MTSTELRVELEWLALSLEAEIGLCQTRAQHIRATANSNQLRHLISRLPEAETV
jgi:hypothetical protein